MKQRGRKEIKRAHRKVMIKIDRGNSDEEGVLSVIYDSPVHPYIPYAGIHAEGAFHLLPRHQLEQDFETTTVHV